jgi:hypothetical protein
MRRFLTVLVLALALPALVQAASNLREHRGRSAA